MSAQTYLGVHRSERIEAPRDRSKRRALREVFALVLGLLLAWIRVDAARGASVGGAWVGAEHASPPLDEVRVSEGLVQE